MSSGESSEKLETENNQTTLIPKKQLLILNMRILVFLDMEE